MAQEPWMRNAPLGATPIADPPDPAKYVIPGSHYLDPPYSRQLSPNWPQPRNPAAFESETRAPGTGLIGQPGTR